MFICTQMRTSCSMNMDNVPDWDFSKFFDLTHFIVDIVDIVDKSKKKAIKSTL
ncbi:hypothetical protein AMA2_45 [Achromobacter phage AMA2]|nr:hypothetical protein AMA2_45 [Achromobacter phage AMA2]